MTIAFDEKVKRITMAVAAHFRTFGGNEGILPSPQPDEPVISMLNNAPLSFTIGVNVEDVVRFVLKEAQKS